MESKIVTIRTFDSSTEAAIVQGLLTSAGIASELLHDTMQSVLPMHGGPFAIQLAVAAEDEKRALEVLAAQPED